MNMIIVGCSGFVGQELRSFFEELGHKVQALSIRENTHVEEIKKALAGVDIVINLAGLSIFGRWSEAYKRDLYSSRINTTKKLVEAINTSGVKRFISTSAVGIYIDEKESDEDAIDLSDSYLSHICQDWEKAALKSKVPLTVFRSGVVLGKRGGMIKKIWLPFSLGLGGKVGSGEQSISWIHIKDLCMAYKKVIDDDLNGIYNLTSPEVTTNLHMTKELGRVMRRPTIFPVPAFILRLIFAEGSDFMLNGQKAYPKRLLDAGFDFEYKNITQAIESFS